MINGTNRTPGVPLNLRHAGKKPAMPHLQADRTRICPPNPYPSTGEDWPRTMSRTWRTEGRWLSEPDVSAWVAASRLNLLQALPDHAAEPSVQSAVKRFLTHVNAAIERLKQFGEPSN